MYSNSTDVDTWTLILPNPISVASIKDKALCIDESIPNPFQ